MGDLSEELLLGVVADLVFENTSGSLVRAAEVADTASEAPMLQTVVKRLSAQPLMQASGRMELWK